jgi:hypothetical protein
MRPAVDGGAADPRWRHVTVVEDGDEVIVGSPDGGYAAVPRAAGVVIRVLQSGAGVPEARAAAERAFGVAVDVGQLIEDLLSCGVLSGARSAPVQRRGWVRGSTNLVVRWLFGPAAWVGYAAAFVGSMTLLVADPTLWPTPSGVLVFDDVGLSVLVLLALNVAGAAVHEGWHWLAAVHAGIPTRFGIDRRNYLLVFETDLTHVWSLPRRSRYGPILAGMAVDSVVLLGLLVSTLGVREGAFAPPGIVRDLLGATTFLVLAGLIWQSMVFLRTDLYAVLLVATGCRDLWRTKTLLLRRAFGRLTAAQRAELATASPRDLRVARWFRWVWLGGHAVVAWWFLTFSLPIVTATVAWIAEGVAAGPGKIGFWTAVLATPVLLSSRLLAAAGPSRGDPRAAPRAGMSRYPATALTAITGPRRPPADQRLRPRPLCDDLQQCTGAINVAVGEHVKAGQRQCEPG